jgi:LIVCS family branched-chain amino acid:cation transporter
MLSSPFKLILTSGFAMFSMFFGSGNLVFPLLVGFKTGANYIYTTFGFLLTAVLVPFLGLLGVMQYRGDRHNYFSIIGKVPSFILSFLMLSLLGPFGVMPRCISVAFGGVQLMYPEFPLWIFSLIFCISVTILIWQPNKIVSIIGLFLTPLKLGSIATLIIIGLMVSSDPTEAVMMPIDSLWYGLHQGYQTMDLIAGLFFATTIYAYIKNNTATKATDYNMMKWGIMASLTGAFLLSVVYIGFVMLGARYSQYLNGVAPEAMLSAIAKIALGKYSLPFMAILLAISCLVTATVLASLFSEFLHEDIFQKSFKRAISIILTMGLSFNMSLLGFDKICYFLSMILEWIYPLLIVFALFQIGRRIFMQPKEIAVS